MITRKENRGEIGGCGGSNRDQESKGLVSELHMICKALAVRHDTIDSRSNDI